MARLEEIKEKSVVLGIVAHEPVTIVSAQWYGTACLDVFYKTNGGQTGERPAAPDQRCLSGNAAQTASTLCAGGRHRGRKDDHDRPAAQETDY